MANWYVMVVQVEMVRVVQACRMHDSIGSGFALPGMANQGSNILEV
jgi:hypothetical protein